MAAAKTILEDIDEKFCQCSICYQQYNTPRQLPCLHRYCSKCLGQLISRSHGVIRCPMCTEEFKVPDNGLDGFKKDFYMNEILDFLQVQTALLNNQVHKCFGCGNEMNSSAYCFRCSGFLCQQCHVLHLNNNIMREHKPHIITLKDIESQNLTIKKLTSLKEAPRCETHPDSLSQLCCKTCTNLPICVACTYGKHKGHTIDDVVELAKAERDRLLGNLVPLNQHRDRVYAVAKQLKAVKLEINNNATEKQHILNTKYKERVKINEEKEKKTLRRIDLDISEINQSHDKNVQVRQREMKREIQQIKDKFNQLNGHEEKENCEKISQLQKCKMKEQVKVKKEKKNIENKFQQLGKTIESEKLSKTKNTEKMSQDVNNTIKRYENLTDTGNKVLSTHNNWTAVQNIDGICSATGSLLRDMKKEMPGLNNLSVYKSSKAFEQFGTANVRISGREESVIKIEGFDGRLIKGITCTGSGMIVLSGGAMDKSSHLTVVNEKGVILNQRLTAQTTDTADLLYPAYYCAPYKHTKLATVCQPFELGLFDVNGGAYIKKNLPTTITGWPENQYVFCVTTDNDGHIIVGCWNSRDLYVFDYQFNHLRSMRLPDGIIKILDITMLNNGNVLICDMVGKRACAVNFKTGNLLYELHTPKDTVEDTFPYSACTDKNELLYILWRESDSINKQNCAIVQYTSDGKSVLAERAMVTDARCITTAEINESEKLLVASLVSGTLHVYDLHNEDED